MINNMILEYQTTIEKIESILRNAKEMGVDIIDYEDALARINIEVNESLSSFGVIGYSEKENINKIYLVGNDKANNLLKDLEKYKEYYQAINKCYYVQGSQDNLDFSSDELNTAVDDLIVLLNVISKYDGVSRNDFAMINTLYEVVYDLIKMEFSYNGTSKLLDYCKNNERNSILLNKLIIEDVENLQRNEYDLSEIDSKMLDLKQKGQTTFLDNDIVYLLSIIKSRDKYIEHISQKLTDITKKLEENSSKIGSLLFEREKSEKNKNRIIADDKYYNSRKTKAIIYNSIPVVISLGVVVGMQFATPRVLFGSEYKTEVETYYAQNGQTYTSEEYRNRLIDSNMDPLTDLTTISVTSPWKLRKYKDDNKTFFEREIATTKIVGVEYDDLSQYLDLDLSTIKDKTNYSVVVERKDSLKGIDNYEQSIYKVIQEHQNASDSKPAKLLPIDKFFCSFLGVMFSILTIMILEIFFAAANHELFESINDLFYELRRISRSKTDVSNYVNKIKQANQDINSLITENIEIKKVYENLKQNPEYKILIKEFEDQKALIDDYIFEFENSSQLSLLMKKEGKGKHGK